MSNRSDTDVTFAAELKAAHLAQIEALTAPGLTTRERIIRFADAARFTEEERNIALQSLALDRQFGGWRKAAPICWSIGSAAYSLFGNMPGCGCPVAEVRQGHIITDDIPTQVSWSWNPTAEDLLPFARIQQERRLG